MAVSPRVGSAGLVARLVLVIALQPILFTTGNASPFSPASLDSMILECAQEISADSLQSYMLTLRDFFTRHTNSDTTSATIGIGAARRWVHDRIVEFENQGGNVTASYDSFDAVIQGISKEHRNVIAEIPGTATGDDLRIYVVGAHLDSRNQDAADSTGFAPGVDDDASGVACVLEYARVMSQKSWPMTFRFIAFTGEEQGLFGSQSYAIRSALLEEPIAGMMANDSFSSIMGVADPDTIFMTDSTLARVFSRGPEDGPHRQFQRYFKAMGDAYVPIQNILIIPAEDRPGRGGDHQPFADEGFTAIRPMEGLEMLALQHTVNDTLGPHLSMTYLRRNAQICLATLGNLAFSPAPPLGLAVGDIGDSTGFRLEWPSTNTEPDLAGYLVTMRTPGSLDYETVLDVGTVNEHIVIAPPSDSVYFGLSILDVSGHPSLIAGEVLGVLSTVPAAPSELTATPSPSEIHLSWAPNAEGDLAGYHVYRSNTSGSGYTQLTPAPLSSTSYDDDSAVPGTFHYYVVTAVDFSLNESVFSEEAPGRLVTLDSGILFVDETKNGGSAWFPSDAVADSVYAVMMNGLQHDVWDVDTLGIPTLSDLGVYSSVMWIADDFNGTFQGFLNVTQFLEDAVPVLSDYMGFGGNVMLTSWEGAKGLSVLDDYPFDPEPGDFLYDYFGIDEIQYKKQKAFTGGLGQSFFSDAALEPQRLKPSWNGALIRGEYMTAMRPGTNVAFLFNSNDPDSAYHHQPCGAFREGGGYRTVYWGFPLYHLDTGDAQQAIEAVMTYFGELPSTGVDASGGRPVALALAQNRPNPFARQTEIVFAVPGKSAEVELTIYDLAGRRVRSLVSDKLPGGVYTEVWNGRNDDGHRVASGLYFYRLKGVDRTLTKKLLLLR
jgi:hypothetical protein